MFGNKTTLKKHILVNHPKTVNCESCDQTFDQFWKLEIHMKTHSSEKLFECKVCDKKFALQWRLKKHMKGHTDQNVKFCQYFNNNQNCIFEETSGCMFRHETAPQCKDLEKCKFRKCQFSLTVHDVIEENSDESDGEIEQDVSNDDKKCAYCNEIADHSKANLQNCSKCELNSTCWAEYNKKWNETPDHIFSTAELREMGFKL